MSTQGRGCIMLRGICGLGRGRCLGLVGRRPKLGGTGLELQRRTSPGLGNTTPARSGGTSPPPAPLARPPSTPPTTASPTRPRALPRPPRSARGRRASSAVAQARRAAPPLRPNPHARRWTTGRRRGWGRTTLWTPRMRTLLCGRSGKLRGSWRSLRGSPRTGGRPPQDPPPIPRARPPSPRRTTRCSAKSAAARRWLSPRRRSGAATPRPPWKRRALGLTRWMRSGAAGRTMSCLARSRGRRRSLSGTWQLAPVRCVWVLDTPGSRAVSDRVGLDLAA
mmetsp:Transcript_2755/g.6272  ORF Transcript_2755/g.6272 Transcript_2755/m.6272 type:complete len:279 (+) Transcript_2755:263-1099(+)